MSQNDCRLVGEERLKQNLEFTEVKLSSGKVIFSTCPGGYRKIWEIVDREGRETGQEIDWV